MFSDGTRSFLPASPAPHWRQVPTNNSQMPVSRRKKSFCSPCWHQPVDLTSSTRVQISATYIDVTRSVSERVVWQGLMSNVGFLTESSTFIIQGRKDTAGQQLSFGTPCRPRSRANMHASFPYLVNQPSIHKVKHLLWAGPSAECWGHISALHKSRGRDRHQFKASWWQRFSSFLSF